MPAASKSVEVNATPERLMSVITDFTRYPRFLPEMEEATLIRREGDVWTVKFAVRIVRKLEYTLRLEKQSDVKLRWTLVEGAFKANNGGWDLVALDGGTRTRATYTIDLDIGMFVPGSVLKTVLEHNLPSTLAAFKAQAEG